MRKTNAIKARKAKARNFGLEAVAVRAMDCIVHTAARDSGLDMNGEELDALGWTPCGGAACAHHVHPRQRGGVGEGRFGLFSGCARHGDEAGESSPIKGPSSKRRAFEAKYGVNIIEVADAIALAHEPPLGIRGLAERWAWWHGMTGHDEHEVATEATDAPERLVGYDLAALMAWTRRRMEREVDARRGMRLDCLHGPDCRADEDWDGLEDDCPPALSFAVGGDLGGVFQGPESDELDGGQYVTEALCEQAGWPS